MGSPHLIAISKAKALHLLSIDNRFRRAMIHITTNQYPLSLAAMLGEGGKEYREGGWFLHCVALHVGDGNTFRGIKVCETE